MIAGALLLILAGSMLLAGLGCLVYAMALGRRARKYALRGFDALAAEVHTEAARWAVGATLLCAIATGLSLGSRVLV